MIQKLVKNQNFLVVILILKETRNASNNKEFQKRVLETTCHIPKVTESI